MSNINNVDLAMRGLRELQSLTLDNTMSNQKCFDKTCEIMQRMEMASQELKTNYADISVKLTEQMNTGDTAPMLSFIDNAYHLINGFTEHDLRTTGVL